VQQPELFEPDAHRDRRNEKLFGEGRSEAIERPIVVFGECGAENAALDALNVVYDEKEKRSFVKLNLLSLLFTLVAILSLMIALAAVVIAPIIFSVIGLSSFFSLAIVVLRWPLLLVLAAVALAAIYRYGPSRTEARWQWLSVGSPAAAIGWLITSVLFSWYIAHFGAYKQPTGPRGQPSV
jgi:membrane protein